MQNTLFSTKLYVPQLRVNAIKRPRIGKNLIDNLLNRGQTVLISGPAGFGKTSLLSEVVMQLNQPVGWLSLDDGDNDPARFWFYFISAIQTISGEFGKSTLSLYRMGQPLPELAIVEMIFNELLQDQTEIMLVIDDFHVIHNQQIQTSIAHLIEHLPPNLHLIISTRIDPPWPLARFRAQNLIFEIRAQDLRFNLDESYAFLTQTMGIRISSDEVASLDTRTEGWIAGLQLAALSLQKQPDVSKFLDTFTGSHIFIAEYLMEEVFQSQPKHIQDFLLKTSLLHKVNGALADAICETTLGKILLAELQRANLFTIGLDDAGIWFRYHQLFVDLLQARLRQYYTESQISVFHQKASAWFKDNGLVTEAVYHAISSKNFSMLASLVEENAFQLLTRGELQTLLHWIQQVPEQLCWQNPKLVVAWLWALTLSGDFMQASVLIQKSQTQKSRENGLDTFAVLSGNIAAIQSFFSMMTGDHLKSLELAELASSLLPEQDVHVHWLLPFSQGSAYLSNGEYEKSVSAFSSLAEMGIAQENLIIWATGITEIAIVRRLQGDLQEVKRVCNQAIARLSDQGARHYGSLAKLEVPFIEVLREQNLLEEALARCNNILEHMKLWPMPTDQLFAHLAKIRVLLSMQDWSAVEEELETTKRFIKDQPVLLNLKHSLTVLEIRFLLERNAVQQAIQLVKDLNSEKNTSKSVRDETQLILVRVHLVQQEYQVAETLLKTHNFDSNTGQKTSSSIEASILLARCLYEQNKPREAISVFLPILPFAESQRIIRVFLDEGAVMLKLLRDTKEYLEHNKENESSIEQTFINELITLLHRAEDTAITSYSSSHIDELIEQLTAREVEVLNLLAIGDSNQVIAEKLFVSLSAVKKHTANIYGKLNVNSRTQAVARARELGLIIS